jgi:hypothetical protein
MGERDPEDGVRRGVTAAATVWVAKLSIATATPHEGQKRFCSATSLPQDAHVGMSASLFMIAWRLPC